MQSGKGNRAKRWDQEYNIHTAIKLLYDGEGNGNPLQYPCLENLMDRGAWWAVVHGVTKSRARLNDNTSSERWGGKGGGGGGSRWGTYVHPWLIHVNI